MRFGSKRLLILVVSTFILSSLLLFIVNHSGVLAASGDKDLPGPHQPASILPSNGPIVEDSVCLECHGEPGLTMKLENGDTLDLYVNPDNYAMSVHGKNGYACVQCHTTLGEYPHPPFSAADLRDVTLQLTTVCDRCHSGEYTLTLDSVHAAAQSAGVREAAVCTDCHGSHNVHRWTDPQTNELLPEARLDIPITCSRCHFDIYQKYHGSVHGAALTEEGNQDVPTCIDCHGVHNIGDPTTNAFRLNSPELCASCHTDPQLMEQYGLSTDVLDTYVSDFHGTTVTLFEKQSPNAPTNKPVCFDCHGVHDISRTDDTETGLQMQENLLVRCKECHPDATSNFPSAWMSHYIPSPEKYSLVYYVDLFYKIFIPLVLGGMLALVALEAGHTTYVKIRRGSDRFAPHSPTDDDSPPLENHREEKHG